LSIPPGRNDLKRASECTEALHSALDALCRLSEASALRDKCVAMVQALSEHPVAKLFPTMDLSDFAALKEDIRLHGVRVPILVHGGQILDGRHRYRACQQLGTTCPAIEWNGSDPWLEVQSRNLLRRHLSKDQVCAIHLLARERFPELVAPVLAARREARLRKAQATGRPRGTKALLSPRGPQSTADVVGTLLGVSGTTLKRVDRLSRIAPELVARVAAGTLSAKRALREIDAKTAGEGAKSGPLHATTPNPPTFMTEPAVQRLRQMVRAEWAQWPVRHRAAFLYGLEQTLRELINESSDMATSRAVASDIRAAR
jgi:hypothetical protein